MNNSTIGPHNTTNTITTSTCKYFRPDNDVQDTFKRLFFILLSVFGILGNVFVFFITFRIPLRRKLHDLIAAMTISDALYILIEIIWNLERLSGFKITIYPSGVLGDIVCKTLKILISSTYMVSLVVLLVIAVERYNATRQTLRRSRPTSRKQRLMVIGACWFIPLAIHSYVFHNAKVVPISLPGVEHEVGFCSFPVTFATELVIAIASIIAVVLVAIAFILSLVTVRRLSEHRSIQAHLNEEQRNRRARRTGAAIRMVLASLMLYTFCWVPYLIYQTILFTDYITNSTIINENTLCIDWPNLWFIVFFFLPFVNSSFSPYLYIVLLPDVREASKKCFCRRFDSNCVSTRASFQLDSRRTPAYRFPRRTADGNDSSTQETIIFYSISKCAEETDSAEPRGLFEHCT